MRHGQKTQPFVVHAQGFSKMKTDDVLEKVRVVCDCLLLYEIPQLYRVLTERYRLLTDIGSIARHIFLRYELRNSTP